ncbi:MAG: hypothetical protein GY822_00205 [Deltaproteobacteria bacterium]|nr:hypothetical protein [Deltaproteobacteria bacterium]
MSKNPMLQNEVLSEVDQAQRRQEARTLLGRSLLVFSVLVFVSIVFPVFYYCCVFYKRASEPSLYGTPVFQVVFLLFSFPVSVLLYQLRLRFGRVRRGKSWLVGRTTSVALFADDGHREPNFDGDALSPLKLGRLAKDLTRIGVGVSLLMPLFIHAVVFVGVNLASQTFFSTINWGGFLGWMIISFFILGHAHLVLAWMVRRFVRNLVLQDIDKGLYSTIAATTVAAAIPGVIAWGIPPALVLVTSCMFVPFFFAWIRGTVKKERLADLNDKH